MCVCNVLNQVCHLEQFFNYFLNKLFYFFMCMGIVPACISDALGLGLQMVMSCYAGNQA